MLALTRASLATLRSALLRDAGPDAAVYLQEAGYAGGEALWRVFGEWLAERTEVPADQLSVRAFEEYVSEFFTDTGWGRIEIGSLGDAVATLDSTDWGEADPDSGSGHPCCHLTTGMFADLFGRVASVPVAVLEVECRSAGAERCRFLVGSPEMMEQIYDEMGRGQPYEAAVAAGA